MILRCVISFVTPDGQAFNAGELYTVEPELGMWLLDAAAGQFAVDQAVPDETGTMDSPPSDRQVGRPPSGGKPGYKKR